MITRFNSEEIFVTRHATGFELFSPCLSLHSFLSQGMYTWCIGTDNMQLHSQLLHPTMIHSSFRCATLNVITKMFPRADLFCHFHLRLSISSSIDVQRVLQIHRKEFLSTTMCIDSKLLVSCTEISQKDPLYLPLNLYCYQFYSMSL